MIQEENRKLYSEALELLSAVWRSIDWDNISVGRRLKIYDEFANKVRSSASSRDLKGFLASLCRKFGIGALEGNNPRVLYIIENAEDQKILEAFREDSVYLVLLLREQQDLRKIKGGN